MSTPTEYSSSGRVIRCVLFDLGDTLWTYNDEPELKRQAERRAVAVLLERSGPEALPLNTEDGCLETTRAAQLDDFGVRVRQGVNHTIRRAIYANADFEPNFAQVTRDALRELGVTDADLALGEMIYEALRVHIPGSRRLFNDTLTTLATLRERGFALGVVTNRHWGGPLFQDDLRALGLLEMFAPQHMAISADLGLRKPNPAIFHYALDALGAAPEEAAMVGDSLRADVAGAQNVGMCAVWKPRLSLRAEVEARWSAKHTTPDAGDAQPIGAVMRPVTNDAKGPTSHPDNYRTADDYLLAYGVAHEFREPPTLIRPDLTITHLGDLLPLLQ